MPVSMYALALLTCGCVARRRVSAGKECGLEAIQFYSQTKSVYVAAAPVWSPFD